MAKKITVHGMEAPNSGEVTVLTSLKVRPDVGPGAAKNLEFLSQPTVAKVKGGDVVVIDKLVGQKYTDDKDGSEHDAIFVRVPKLGGWILLMDKNQTKDTAIMYANWNPNGAEQWAKMQQAKKESGGGGGGGGGGGSGGEIPPPESDSNMMPVLLGLAGAAVLYFTVLKE